CDPVLAAHYRVSESLCQRFCYLVAERRDEMNPVGTQTWSQDRDGDDPTSFQTEFLRHDTHDVAIAERLGTADIKDATRGLGGGQRSGQIPDHISDGNRL